MGKNCQAGRFPVPVAPPSEAPKGPKVWMVFTSWSLGAGTHTREVTMEDMLWKRMKEILEKEQKEKIEKKKKRYQRKR